MIGDAGKRAITNNRAHAFHFGAKLVRRRTPRSLVTCPMRCTHIGVLCKRYLYERIDARRIEPRLQRLLQSGKRSSLLGLHRVNNLHPLRMLRTLCCLGCLARCALRCQRFKESGTRRLTSIALSTQLGGERIKCSLCAHLICISTA